MRSNKNPDTGPGGLSNRDGQRFHNLSGRPRLILTTLVVLAMLVAACSSNSASTTTAMTDTETTADEDAPTTTQAAAEPDTGGIATVRFLNQETGPDQANVLRQWQRDFAEAHPDIDIIMESTSPDLITQKVATYVQSGAPLDIVAADPGSAARLASEGRLLPLDNVVEALGGESAFAVPLLKIDGVVYGLNMTGTPPTLYYRTDLFADAGLEPPTNWDELLNAARTLHSDEVAGIAIPGGENRATTILGGQFVWQACGDFFDSDYNVTLDSPGVIEAIDYYAGLLQYAPEDAITFGFFEGPQAFAAGRAAMMIAHNGFDVVFGQNPDLILEGNMGSVPLPGHRISVAQQGGRFMGIWATSENVEAAETWLTFIYQPENWGQLTASGPEIYLPQTNAAADFLPQIESDRIAAYGDSVVEVKVPAIANSYSEVLNLGGINTSTCELEETGVPNPLTSVLWNSDIFATAIQRVAYDGWDAADAAREAQAELEPLVADVLADLGLR